MNYYVKAMLCATMLVSSINAQVVTIHNEQEFNAIVANNSYVVVKFSGKGCPPCQKFAPIFERTSQVFSNVIFAAVDVGAVPALSNRFSVKSIPTLLYFKQGQLANLEKGFKSSNQFESSIRSILGL